MALGYDYLTFNSTVLPWATANNTGYAQVQTEGQSEAGYDLVTVIRKNKPTFSYTFRVTDFWKDKLIAISELLSGTLYINGDAGHTVRPELQSTIVVQDSELTEGTNGLYDVTINFIER